MNIQMEIITSKISNYLVLDNKPEEGLRESLMEVAVTKQNYEKELGKEKAKDFQIKSDHGC